MLNKGVKVDLNIDNKVLVTLLLKNYNNFSQNRNTSLYTLADTIYPYDKFQPSYLELKGLPYIYISPEKVEIFTGFYFAPIFYTFKFSNKITHYIISDDIFQLLYFTKHFKAHISEHVYYEFLEFGYCLANKTLINNVHTIEPGEKLVIDSNGLRCKPIFPYEFLNFRDTKEEIIEPEELLELIFNIIREYVDHLKMKKIILIPLSAGIDSRLVTSILYLLGLNNIVTYTYGLKDTEYPVAREIARMLGYEHIFIQYTTELFQKYIREIINNLPKFSQLFISPNIQEYIAIRELSKLLFQKDKYNPGECIIVTGDVPNLIVGKTPPHCVNNINDILAGLSNFFPPYPKSLIKTIRDYVIRLAAKYPYVIGGSILRCYEIMHLRERYYKFVLPLRVLYRLFGPTKYIAPLIDGRIFIPFLNIPWSIRYKRGIYKKAAFKLFKDLGIDLKDPTKGAITFNSFREYLIMHVPLRFQVKFVKLFFRRYYQLPRDACNLHKYYPEILKKSLYERKIKILPYNIKCASEYLYKRAPRHFIAFISLATLLRYCQLFT